MESQPLNQSSSSSSLNSGAVSKLSIILRPRASGPTTGTNGAAAGEAKPAGAKRRSPASAATRGRRKPIAPPTASGAREAVVPWATYHATKWMQRRQDMWARDRQRQLRRMASFAASVESDELKASMRAILRLGAKLSPYQAATVAQEQRHAQTVVEAIRRAAVPEAKRRKRAVAVPTAAGKRRRVVLSSSASSLAAAKSFTEAWKQMAKRDIPRAAKTMQLYQSVRMQNAKRQATMVSREAKRAQARTNRRMTATAGPITHTIAARRHAREMLSFWRRYEREEREARKKAEKEAADRARAEEEAREARRQARKLNFLLTQTELYGHFIAGKATATKTAHAQPLGDLADVSEETLREHAAAKAMAAVQRTQTRMQAFDDERQATVGSSIDLTAPSTLAEASVVQPRILQCQLKPYQLRGLSWLANLYEQGINGILADEMGLGKTVQAISLLTHLAEAHGLWGPFLVITPASTLHNWQQEFAKFVPEFKVLPYWGSVSDRKTLRRFWDPKRLYTRDAHFHVLVTSYQLVVADEKYFQRIKWQYMVLDEAQAIKSSVSTRWQTLLGFKCRNRLLLTGTPIQNSMQELWALLHFIMPGLFDSHDEFAEWFSKGIEASSSGDRSLDRHQLHRLHMILKPFMLRRVKRDVENELGDKVEVALTCALSPKQRAMYEGLRERLPATTLLSQSMDVDSLMNLVMQFRKVCNHPELFERTQVDSPLVLGSVPGGGADGLGDARILGPAQNSALCALLQDMLRCRFIQRADAPVRLDVQRPIPCAARVEPLVRIDEGDAVRSLGRIPPVAVPRCEAYVSPDRHVPAPFVIRTPVCRDSPFAALLAPLPKLVKPDFASFIADSGKLRVLDGLLARLLREGHRVLIYNQMTRMIDLLEEYLQYRHYRYLRLDGSTRIADRRDLVTDWQTKPELFVFLLSTRAGGLGINLTAADTVIFYDSDWNPTVDQQAMDRAHRLGQTKQVTVYRLITRGTIEERIILRAKQKHAIHQVVIDRDGGGEGDGDGEEVAVIDDDAQEKIRPSEIVDMLFGDDDRLQ